MEHNHLQLSNLIGQFEQPGYKCKCVQKIFLNHTLAAISHRETMVEGLLFSLHTNALAVEAIGASCTRQFSRQICYSVNAHHLRTGSHTH